MEQWKKDAFKHASDCKPNECCGLLYTNKKEIKYGPCKNLAYEEPETSFVIDPLDWVKYEDIADENEGEIIGIIHSHPDGDLQFSETDIASCNFLEVDFYLVDPSTESIISIKPKK
tara:strand:- start:640 stop:987 length:348 start_codon:yes stop_codon:yes gene_type:complete